MSEPVCVQKSPYVLELDAGDYYWCSCGKSTNQPFCNGAHKDTDLEPVKFTLTEKKTVSLCGCKHTRNAPYCDGAHNKV